MEDENELIALRRKKLEALRAKGIDPFGAGFDVSGSIAEVREQFKEGEARRVAGRITAHRARVIFSICVILPGGSKSTSTQKRLGRK